MSKYLDINGLKYFKKILYNDLNLTKEEPEFGDIPHIYIWCKTYI